MLQFDVKWGYLHGQVIVWEMPKQCYEKKKENQHEN